MKLLIALAGPTAVVAATYIASRALGLPFGGRAYWMAYMVGMGGYLLGCAYGAFKTA